MRPEIYHPQVFYDTACYQRMKTETQDRQFNAYFKGLENRLGELANTSNTKINEFMHQIIQLQRDLYLFHSFVTTQFDMLWELGDLSLQHPLLLDHAVLDSNLLEAIKSAWQKKYAKNINKFQKLEDQLKTLLKQSSPSPNDFKCAVCLSILDDPITLSGCYHTFCRDCIQHIYCATCHKNHRHDSYKATTAVVCTCQRIHSLTGEPTTEEKPIVRCPLCRTEFKPTDCQHDKALSKFISLYFPKPPLPKHKVIASTIQRWSNQPSYYFDDDIFSLVARHSWMF
ncbi:hypothetical protein K501DRAFT_280578 [Backusella circina FSU 941]|nr:hypothetical protein K501DRAFT_280578 [Backusella circina FSU 941]